MQPSNKSALFWRILSVTYPLILLVIVVLSWGKGHRVTPRIVEAKLYVGMTMDDAIGLLEYYGLEQEGRQNDRAEYVTLSSEGLGSFFVPNYSYALYFRDGKLVSVSGSLIHGLVNDIDFPIAIRKRPW